MLEVELTKVKDMTFKGKEDAKKSNKALSKLEAKLKKARSDQVNAKKLARK